MLTLTHVLAGLGLLAGYIAFVAASATQRCHRCGARRVVRSRLTKRTIPCPRCKSTGRHYRPGAVIVHRFIQSARAERDSKQVK